MDPKACLLAAVQAISDENFEQARELLDAYAQWRQRGGFEPVDVGGQRGDVFVLACERRLLAALYVEQRRRHNATR
jgi:hypothetical protein